MGFAFAYKGLMVDLLRSHGTEGGDCNPVGFTGLHFRYDQDAAPGL